MIINYVIYLGLQSIADGKSLQQATGRKNGEHGPYSEGHGVEYHGKLEIRIRAIILYELS